MLNNDMGKKISELTTAAKPLSGGEVIPMNQNGSTVTASLSDVKSYTLGGASLSGYPTLSGSNVFTGSNNTFTNGLSTENIKFSDSDIIKIGDGAGFTTGYLVLEDMVAIGRDSNSNIATEGGTAREVVSIGHYSGNSLANSGDCNKTISIGYFAGGSLGCSGGMAIDIIAIGSEACYLGGGDLSNVVAVGNNAGYGCGSNGTATNVVAVGSYAGYGIGNYGAVAEIIAIGSQAGRNSGSQNSLTTDVIVIGNNAGYNIGAEGISVSNIIAIGKDAGFEAGFSSDISNSIFIGLSSGMGLSNSSRNTFIGDLTNTQHGLSSCIALGYGAKPTATNTIAIGSTSAPLSVVPGTSLATSLSGLRIMINGTYYTIPLLA